MSFPPPRPTQAELHEKRQAKVPWKVLSREYGLSRTTLWLIWRGRRSVLVESEPRSASVSGDGGADVR